jgi:KUP system potassium uptake protein
MEGGFVPILIGCAIFVTMATWRWGRKATFDAYAANYTMPMNEMIAHHRDLPSFIERTSILMVPVVVHSNKVRTPTLLQMMWKRTGALPRNIIYVQVKHLKVPFMHGNRYSVHVLERNERGSIIHVQMQFGFMEDPNVEIALQEMLEHKDINLPTNLRHWVVHVAVENLIADKSMSWLSRVRLEFFILLRTACRPAYFHYGLGNKVALSAEIFPIDLK